MIQSALVRLFQQLSRGRLFGETSAEPTEQQMLASANERYRNSPIGIWTIPSDGGETIFRDFVLVFRSDHSGTFDYRCIDDGRYPNNLYTNNRAGAFEWREVSSFCVDVRIVAPEHDRTDWQQVEYRFGIRENQYEIRILVIEFVSFRELRKHTCENDPFWAFEGRLDYAEPKEGFVP